MLFDSLIKVPCIEKCLEKCTAKKYCLVSRLSVASKILEKLVKQAYWLSPETWPFCTTARLFKQLQIC